MAFCGSCGTRVDDGVKFCPGCGAAIGAAAGVPTGAAPQGGPAYTQPQSGPAYTQPQGYYTPPVVPGAPTQADVRDAQDNKVMAVLAYFGPLVLIPIFVAKESPFARFHSNQGLVLAIGTAALSLVYNILTSLLYKISWSLGLSVSGILGLAFFVPSVLAILGIINACEGEKKALPVIGGSTLLK